MAVEFGQFELGLFELNFSTYQFILQLHNDPIFDFLSLARNVLPLIVVLLHQNFQSCYLVLTFSVKLLLTFLLFNYFS